MEAKYIFRSIAACSVALCMLLPGCTDLDEELYGQLSPDNYYQTEEEALSSVAGVYRYFTYLHSAGGEGWRTGEYGTDEFFCPGRSNGGWYSDESIQLMTHTWDADHSGLAACWSTYLFPTVGAANAVLASLESSPVADELANLIAETRMLRAYGYYYAMDYFGNVPLFTGDKVDANNLPSSTDRAEIWAFIVEELLEAAEDLPSITEVDLNEYYPRFTKEAAYTVLASLYLNAEVYADEEHWSDVVTMCDKVINTGGYALEEKVGDCFLSTNEENSCEIIISLSNEPSQSVGGNEFILYAQHSADADKYSLSFTPACGYCFGDDALNRYEEGDERLELLEYGPQYYQDGETPLIDTDTYSATYGGQLILSDLEDLYAASDDQGYRVLKYSPVGATFSGSSGDNDYIVERYSNVLLMKAEALVRLGQSTSTALDLVNQVRTRSECSEWTEDDLTLENIEAERAREFIWENQRRRDMIRFGTFFSGTWFGKTTTTPEYRGVYPIPNTQLNNNPNLTQNPGY